MPESTDPQASTAHPMLRGLALSSNLVAGGIGLIPTGVAIWAGMIAMIVLDSKAGPFFAGECCVLTPVLLVPLVGLYLSVMPSRGPVIAGLILGLLQSLTLVVLIIAAVVSLAVMGEPLSGLGWQ